MTARTGTDLRLAMGQHHRHQLQEQERQQQLIRSKEAFVRRFVLGTSALLIAGLILIVLAATGILDVFQYGDAP